MGKDDRPLKWIGTSLSDLRTFPPEVQSRMGYALRTAQEGSMDPDAKVLQGFGGAGVLEVAERFERNAYRAVYTVGLANAIYVLHVFQKKSKTGIVTSSQDMDMIRRRLREAEMLDAVESVIQRGADMINDIRLEDIQVTESSGNVFADLGLPNAEEALAKADLAIAINRTMEERGLTERQASAMLGTSQSRLHNVRRGRLTGVTTDWLLQALNRLGLDIEINVKPKPHHRAHARTTVASRISAGASRR